MIGTVEDIAKQIEYYLKNLVTATYDKPLKICVLSDSIFNANRLAEKIFKRRIFNVNYMGVWKSIPCTAEMVNGISSEIVIVERYDEKLIKAAEKLLCCSDIPINTRLLVSDGTDIDKIKNHEWVKESEREYRLVTKGHTIAELKYKNDRYWITDILNNKKKFFKCYENKINTIKDMAVIYVSSNTLDRIKELADIIEDLET